MNSHRPRLTISGTTARRIGAALFLLSIWFAPGAPALAAAPTTAPVLLAHGSAETFWYAVVRTDSNGDSVTQAWARPLQTGNWQPMLEIPGRAIQLTDYRGELLVVFDDGQWKRLSPSQFMSGPPLGAAGSLLSIAAGRDGLFALCLGSPPVAASTSVATTKNSTSRAAITPVATTRGGASTVAAPSRASSGPATSPATQPARLQLYQLSNGGWAWQGELPETLQSVKPAMMSLAVVGSELLLASVDEAGQVLVHRFDTGAALWVEVSKFAPGLKATGVKLIAVRDRAVLWVRSVDGAGVLAFRQQQGTWSEPKLIDLSPATPFTAVSVAAAGDEIRVLAVQGTDKLLEQKYGTGGELTQPLAEITSTRVPIERPGLMQMLLLLVLGCFILTNLSQRKPVQVIEINKVRLALAPLAPRLVAGLIDATPVLITLIWAIRTAPNASGWQQWLNAGTVRWLVLGSWAFYVLHTSVAELIWQRSFGKMFVGLRVVGFDGLRPKPRAVIVRNFLRLIDVVLMGFSLTSIFFSPLRQRLGDVPAATLVVVDLPKDADTKATAASEE